MENSAENCNQACSSCSENCTHRKKEDQFAPLHAKASVKKVIGIVSGKGGVGKSLVTSLLALGMQKKGRNSAILDADITGPSIPQCFGLHTQAGVRENALVPVRTKSGIQVMSINLLLEQETQPVIFRGPVIAQTVTQFWSEVIWDQVEVMFVDMPPGTGDVPLTVFQSLPLDGIIVVTSPQQLVSMIVEKAVNMAKQMQIPILGMVENMSYFTCPDCGKKYSVFGESHIDEIAAQYEIPAVAKIPINPELARACDRGMVEEQEHTFLDSILQRL